MSAPLCVRCRKRPAIFLDGRGRARSGLDHDLCGQCYRSQRDHDRAGKILGPKNHPPRRHPRRLETP